MPPNVWEEMVSSVAYSTHAMLHPGMLYCAITGPHCHMHNWAAPCMSKTSSAAITMASLRHRRPPVATCLQQPVTKAYWGGVHL